jgi:hypothetical protein
VRAVLAGLGQFRASGEPDEGAAGEGEGFLSAPDSGGVVEHSAEPRSGEVPLLINSEPLSRGNFVPDGTPG